MTAEQQSIAEDFKNLVEIEYALCVREIRRTNKAIVNVTVAQLDEQRKLDCANREIDAIQKYWQGRLGNLIKFIETKSITLNKELARKYLSY